MVHCHFIEKFSAAAALFVISSTRLRKGSIFGAICHLERAVRDLAFQSHRKKRFLGFASK